VATLTWLDRSGNPLESIGEQDSYFDLDLSADDQRVAVSSAAPDGNIDIWAIDLAHQGNKHRITTDPGFEFHPDWSADGKYISFTSNRNGRNQVFRRQSDAGGSDVMLADADGAAQAVWSSKERVLFFRSAGDLWTQSLDGGQKPAIFAPTPFVESGPVVSPDGRWIAYSSDRTGRPEVYLRPFPSRDPEHKVSLDGGKMPRWRTMDEIFFLSLDGTLMSARFNATGQPVTGIPRRLFPTGLADMAVWNRPYDVARNGQRFLLPVARDEPVERLITIVTNWTARVAK
jgi:Tol biopolymer transport system component